MMGRDRRVAVSVLTHNRREEVLRTLDRRDVLNDKTGIWVVDNASEDDTAAAIARTFPTVKLIRLERNMGAAGRNAAVREIEAPYVAFCDDDTWWTQGSLSRAAELLDAYPRVGVITARVLVSAGAREDPTSTQMARSPFPNRLGFPGTSVVGFLAGACVMRRAAFLEAGGYDPRFFLGGEEALLTIDLMVRGWHLAYAPDIVVRHFPSPRRDVPGRKLLQTRNALWCAWLRRPLANAAKQTIRFLAEAARSGAMASAAASALSGLRWIPGERRRVPDAVEHALQVRDAHDRRSTGAAAIHG